VTGELDSIPSDEIIVWVTGEFDSIPSDEIIGWVIGELDSIPSDEIIVWVTGELDSIPSMDPEIFSSPKRPSKLWNPAKFPSNGYRVNAGEE
jgi:hypothetical protein